jgi:hypothetical protein
MAVKKKPAKKKAMKPPAGSPKKAPKAGPAKKAAVKKVSAARCMQIVVESTPNPDDFKDPSQKLRELGVINADQAALHRKRIVKKMQDEDGDIDPNKINSGPSVSVATCTASVFENQDGA